MPTVKLKSTVAPLQWWQRKRAQLREKRELKREEKLNGLNAVDLAEEEARRIVAEEGFRDSQGGNRKGKLNKTRRVRGLEVSDDLDISDRWMDKASASGQSMRFDELGDISAPSMMMGTGIMKTRQKGAAGVEMFLEESAFFSASASSSDVDYEAGGALLPSTSPNNGRSHKSKRPSLKMTLEEIANVPELKEALRNERVKEWASRFRRTDPRHQIMKYFDDVAILGVNQTTELGRVEAKHISPILKMFYKSAIFTVWRPTSMDAIRKMMKGQGVGKGLDIKGKSAKTGKLSGFVPFLQIHSSEAHKRQIRTLPKTATLRIFFQSQALRDDAAEELTQVGQEMLQGFEAAQQVLGDEHADDEAQERAMEKFMWEMENPEIVILDEYANNGDDAASAPEAPNPVFGVEIPERLFWEAFVMRQDITRLAGTEDDTGRPSHPVFQDMNFATMRHAVDEGKARPVIYQHDTVNPMEPKDLLVAYEENNHVLPVVSDFDCFLVGTRAVSFDDAIPPNQVELAQWSVDKIDNILQAGPQPESWTERWLKVLKEDSGMKPNIPPYGFGDPKSYSLMELAVARLKKDGCVRHGAECFNYYFPQELDDHFLVIGEGMNGNKGPPWKYVSVAGLQEILHQKLKEGFTFPLNPKWILCDPGWKAIYDKMLASDSPNVQKSLDCWYPPESGIRESIARISEEHPSCFVRQANTVVSESSPSDTESLTRHGKSILSRLETSDENDGTAAMDLAQLELNSYETLKRAKKKMKALLIWMSFIMAHQKNMRERENAKKKDADNESDPTSSSSSANDKKDDENLSAGVAFRKTLQPMLRDHLRQTFKPQQLTIRDSLARQPKLLDRLQRHSSFAGKSSHHVLGLRSRASLPATAVSASLQGRFAGSQFQKTTLPAFESLDRLDKSFAELNGSDGSILRRGEDVSLQDSSSSSLNRSEGGLKSHSLPVVRREVPQEDEHDDSPKQFRMRRTEGSLSAENDNESTLSSRAASEDSIGVSDLEQPRPPRRRKILEGSGSNLNRSIDSLPSRGGRAKLRTERKPGSSPVRLEDLHRVANEHLNKSSSTVSSG